MSTKKKISDIDKAIEEMATIWPQLQAAQTMLDAYFDATKIL